MNIFRAASFSKNKTMVKRRILQDVLVSEEEARLLHFEKEKPNFFFYLSEFYIQSYDFLRRSRRKAIIAEGSFLFRN